MVYTNHKQVRGARRISVDACDPSSRRSNPRQYRSNLAASMRCSETRKDDKRPTEKISAFALKKSTNPPVRSTPDTRYAILFIICWNSPGKSQSTDFTFSQLLGSAVGRTGSCENRDPCPLPSVGETTAPWRTAYNMRSTAWSWTWRTFDTEAYSQR